MGLARAIGQAMLKSLVGQALPGWQMIQIVRSAGYGYNYQTMLSDIREYTGRFKNEYQITRATSNDIISERLMNQVDMNYPYRYKVWADVKYYDPETNSYITDTRSVYTDDLLKKSDYEGFIEGVEIAGHYNEGMELVDVRIRGIDRNTNIT